MEIQKTKRTVQEKYSLTETYLNQRTNKVQMLVRLMMMIKIMILVKSGRDMRLFIMMFNRTEPMDFRSWMIF